MKTLQLSKILNRLTLAFNKDGEVVINLAAGQSGGTLLRKYAVASGKKTMDDVLVLSSVIILKNQYPLTNEFYFGHFYLL